jgi:hypothetical protein
MRRENGNSWRLSRSWRLLWARITPGTIGSGPVWWSCTRPGEDLKRRRVIGPAWKNRSPERALSPDALTRPSVDVGLFQVLEVPWKQDFPTPRQTFEGNLSAPS